MTGLVLDGYAGPGGWDQGMCELDITNVVGIEYEHNACKTAVAAGHRRIRAAQYLQVGNAIPPRLAAHIVAAATGRTYRG